MKHLSKAVLTATFILSIFTASVAQASILAPQVVQRVQITDVGAAYFRPTDLAAWVGDDCNPYYAYITKDIAAYQEILTLVMASKLNGSPIQFHGTCSASGHYLVITYAFLY